MKKVAILGCGPAGLLAAHAVAETGVRPVVFSRAVPSEIGGAQYLHRAIPEVTGDAPDGLCEVIKLGTPAGYATKVYNDPASETSWKIMDSGDHKIWNMRRAYNWLWGRYEGNITDQEVDADRVESLLRQYDLILSTVPAVALCAHANRHEFVSQQVGIVYHPAEEEGPNRIIYNGKPDGWYRASEIFGWVGFEYAPEESPSNAKMVRKPLWTDCNCHPDLVRLGRYGKWKKGELIHHAYEGALVAMGNLR